MTDGDSIYYDACPDCTGEGNCGAQHRLTGVTCTRGAACDGHHVACTSAHRVHRWSTADAPPREAKEGRAPRVGSAESKERREKLLEALRRAAVPLGEWSRANGYVERDVRGDVGSLRNKGHKIRAIGSGRFALEEAK